MDGEETFAEKVERLRPQRENKPEECSHCGHATTELANYSRAYGDNVGGHWLCRLCEHTRSASRLGAGGRSDETVVDIAAMLNVLLDALRSEDLDEDSYDCGYSDAAKQCYSGLCF